MGQYYVIANPDKKEFLTPDTFGDGSKLLEFSSNSEGMLQALAILTASGNGNGMEDLYRSVDNDGGATKYNPWEPREWESLVSESKSTWSDITYRTIAPTIAGRWAGDRIVTAGDYADDGLYLTPEEHAAGLRRRREEKIRRHNEECVRAGKGRSLPTEAVDWTADALHKALGHRVTCNLFHYAGYFFRDVGPEVKFALDAYGHGRHSYYNIEHNVENLLARCLLNEYRHKLTHKRRTVHLLHWMTPEILDSLLRCCVDKEHLKQVKAWLRQQQLTDWQRELLCCYLAPDHVSYDRIFEIAQRYGLTAGDRINSNYSNLFPPLLPRPDLLYAALLQQAQEEDPAWRRLLSCTPTDDSADRRRKARGPDERTRLIQLKQSDARADELEHPDQGHPKKNRHAK